MNKIKLNKLRKRLDSVDIKLLKLIKQRTEIVKKVLKLKKYKNQIVDKKRISLILKNIRVNSIKKNIDPKITKKIWRAMIYSYIDFEKRIFKKK